MDAVFIAGAGTDIGKTYVTALLARQLRAGGRAVRVLKPVVSGVPPVDDPAFEGSDTARLLTAAGVPVTPRAVEECSPWRFAAALAPDRAAALEGVDLRLEPIVAWCRDRLAEAAPDETVLIEGAGGLMSPIARDATGLDWMLALDRPVILVVGTYLGAISHALSAIAVIQARGLVLRAVVVSESETSVGLAETIDALERFAPGTRLVALRRGGTEISPLTEP
jgi:dethiobiotin synthetase